MRLWEIKMARKAFRQRWPMTDAARKKVMEELIKVVKKPTSQPCCVQAARALIEADKQNMEQEKRDLGIADRVDLTSGGQPLTKVILGTDDNDD